ncbi:MATE efflux family protein [Euphorbia peplus]|nr:MATE efflux family protein [Euphorbia peplus]
MEGDSLNSGLLTSSSSVEGGNEDKKISKEEAIQEVKKQLWLSGPLVGVSLLQYCLQLISVMFVGHLGQLSLSGASMATSFATVTGFSLLMGMASALDTYCGQSYGAKQYSMMGIHMQRAMFVLIITQNIVFPMMFFSGITALTHVLVCWLLVFKSGLGSKGAALANDISYWVNVILLGMYVKFSGSCSKTWTGFSVEALQNIFGFLRLAIPSAVMVCMEMWAFELMVLLSGLLPNPQLETSVLSISLSTAATAWMIPFGLSGAVSTRVSNELGAGNPKIARLAVYVVLLMAITEGIILGGLLISIRKVWGYAYSNEVQVIKYVALMLPLVATSNFLDGLQCVLSGNARGCGWQKIGAFINLGSYYLVGIPCSVLFGFTLHIGGKGLWIGIICALMTQVVCLLIITIRTDWEQEANKAKQRVSTGHEEMIS